MRHWTVLLHALETALYHMGIVEQPPQIRRTRHHAWAERFVEVPQPELRASMVRYLELVATQRRPGTVQGYRLSLVTFARYLADHAPNVQRISDLRRKEHIEPWLVWNAARRRVLPDGRSKPVSAGFCKDSLIDIKVFLDTITEWGWEEAPARPLLFNSDLPRLDQPLPRYIPREREVRLMAAIRELPDPFQRYPLEICARPGCASANSLTWSSTAYRRPLARGRG